MVPLSVDWSLSLVSTGALETKISSLEGTDGPLSAQIHQTQLTPSALSSKSHWLQWHLLLGAQLYNLVSPIRFSKAPICTTDVDSTEHISLYSGLTPQWGCFQPFTLGLASAPVTQDLLRGQASSPLGIQTLPWVNWLIRAVILHKRERKQCLIKAHIFFRTTTKVKSLLVTILILIPAKIILGKMKLLSSIHGVLLYRENYDSEALVQ